MKLSVEGMKKIGCRVNEGKEWKWLVDEEYEHEARLEKWKGKNTILLMTI